MSPTINERVLVYTRIAYNRRKTWLLVAIAIASIIPFVLAVSYGVSTIVMSEFAGSYSHPSTAEEINSRLADYRKYAENPSYIYEIRRHERERREQAERDVKLDREIWVKMIGLVSLLLLAVLGLLFWGIASSPTSKVLTLTGARPADTPEAECKRLLENLSIGAGLPTPRLYVIETSSPNAFAAGTDPKHSVVVVTRGLLQLMDQRELEGVLAHELSHIANQDTRLNTIVASIALFLRLPYLLRKRQRRGRGAVYNYNPVMRRFRMYRLAMSPLYLYVFFIAPVLASVIRAAISRSREYLADADAALLTRYPEGLMRALAKIRGAGSAIATANPVVSHFYFGDPTPPSFSFGLFNGNLLATHPPIDQRILKLAEYHGGVPASVIEQAIRSGQQYTKDHPDVADNDFAPVTASDELSVLSVGDPMGRACRVVGLKAPAPMYDQPTPHSPIVRRIKNGDLLVVFDDPGKYRQVITSDQTFGYIPYSVKLEKTNLFPNEVFGIKPQPAAPPSTAAAPAPAPAPAAMAAAPPPTVPAAATVAMVEEPLKVGGLTPKQLGIAAAVFLGVFAAMIVGMAQLSGR
jgi:heat shock protein HtpX